MELGESSRNSSRGRKCSVGRYSIYLFYLLSAIIFHVKYQVGDLIIGKVTSVKPYALFLSFEGGVNGLLHISELSDAYIRDIEKFGSLGDEIKVKVLSVDETNGFLRVSLKRIPEEEQYSSHVNESRIFLKDEEKDFSVLEEKLPTWINETLKKVKGEK